METIFISYSHKDEDWKDRVVTQLQVLARQGHVETWDDRQIRGGEDWYAKIMQAIEKGGIAVLLVSANSLTSEFILKEEIPRLQALRDAGKLRLIPLIIKPCPWQVVDWLKAMNLRPKDGKPLSTMTEAGADEAITALALEIFQLIKASLDATPNTAFPSDHHPNTNLKQPDKIIEVSGIKPIRRGPNPLLDFLRCNRSPQQSAFHGEFTKWFRTQPGIPQFHIIYGRKEDRPNSLARRLGELELEIAAAWLQKQKLLDVAYKPKFADVVWPAIPAGQDQLKLAPHCARLINNLFETFFDGERCDYYPEADWPRIFADRWRESADKPVIVAISHEIKCWEQATYALAEYYRDFWRSFWKEITSPVAAALPQRWPQFLLFLHVQYKPEPKPANWLGKLWGGKTEATVDVSQALTQLSETLIKMGFQAQVLEKLTEVTADDVLEWAKECQYIELDRKFEKRIQAFYGQRQQIPMIEVEEWLEERCQEFSRGVLPRGE